MLHAFVPDNDHDDDVLRLGFDLVGGGWFGSVRFGLVRVSLYFIIINVVLASFSISILF